MVSKSLHFCFGLIWFLLLIQMACFSWKDRGYLKMAKGLFCSLLRWRNRWETNYPLIHKTLGSASRTIILGKSSLSAGATTIDWEWEETHGEEPQGMVVLDCTVWVSSKTHLHSFTCYVTLGRLLHSFEAAIHLWKWSWWCCSYFTEFWGWKETIYKTFKG